MKLKEYRAALQRMIRGEQRVHIPVRPDDDDVLIHNALDDLEAAWEEVKRLKEENERLTKRDQLSKEDAEHFASIGFEFSEQIKLLENQLQDALNTLKWYGDKRNYEEISDGYIPVEKDDGSRARESIDRIQIEQSGGTGE